MELSIAAFVDIAVSVGGSTMRARRWTAGYRVGDLLWVVVIAFLFALITGVLG